MKPSYKNQGMYIIHLSEKCTIFLWRIQIIHDRRHGLTNSASAQDKNGPTSIEPTKKDKDKTLLNSD